MCSVVVYATCTLRAAENQDIVRWFEEKHGARFKPAGLQEAWGKDVWDAVCAKQEPPASHFLSLFPHVYGTDGFFMARWQRVT